MNRIDNMTFDNERALYGAENLLLCGCTFGGPADGESALKRASEITLENCRMELRYPFWHDRELIIRNGEMTPDCRAALWYSENVEITDTKLHGIKALRECRDVTMRRCDIASPEFGWSVNGIVMEDCEAKSEYFMLRSEKLRFKNVRLTGKYSFQYIHDAVFESCAFDTKDAFWHAENVVVRNSVIKGEYLGWYSHSLRFENCRITGTQPLCCCEGLVLDGCEMLDADLCFELSHVDARLTAPLLSVKNPLSGIISAPAIGEIIKDDPNSAAQIICTAK